MLRWVTYPLGWVHGIYARFFGGLPAQQAADVGSALARAAHARSMVWESIDIMDIIFAGVPRDDHNAISLTSKQLWFALRACACGTHAARLFVLASELQRFSSVETLLERRPNDIGTGERMHACWMAARHGNVRMLQLLLDSRCEPDERACSEAAELRNLPILQILRAHDCEWSIHTFAAAYECLSILVFSTIPKQTPYASSARH